MARKVTDGPLKNKERTKEKVINALALILKKDGFTNLTISKVAAKASVDRKLIYDYFGSLEGVIKEYLNAKDYWDIAAEDLDYIVAASKPDFGEGLAYGTIEKQFDSLMDNEEMRRIITWGLSDNRKPLHELDLKREQLGEYLIAQVIDEHFENKDKSFRAIQALLMGGVYYLTLHAHMQQSTFCGIDLRTEKGAAEIKKTIKQILDWTYA